MVLETLYFGIHKICYKSKYRTTHKQSNKNSTITYALNTGDPGSHGGNGENGRRAGHSGSGGDSKKITLNTKYIFGSFKVTQRSGNGGLPAIHGHGGRER